MDFNPVSAPSVEHKMYLRGQVGGFDFVYTDLTLDNNWNELDISSIVPVGTVAVYINGMLSDDVANTYIFFGENGYTPLYNMNRIYTPAANQPIGIGCWVGVDANRKIQYKHKAVTPSVCSFVIAAYIK